MAYIIFDLEWNKMIKSGDHPYITEIGAVKVEDINGDIRIVDTFHRFVKLPKTLNKRLFNKSEYKSVDPDKHFHLVYIAFKNWIRDELNVLITWGNDDMSVINYNCDHYSISSKLNNKYFDLQKIFGIIFKEKNQVSLKNALAHLGLEFTGKSHRSIDDAMNTFLVFNKLYSLYNLIECLNDEFLTINQPKNKKEVLRENNELYRKIIYLKQKSILNNIDLRELSSRIGISKSRIWKIFLLDRCVDMEELLTIEEGMEDMIKKSIAE